MRLIVGVGGAAGGSFSGGRPGRPKEEFGQAVATFGARECYFFHRITAARLLQLGGAAKQAFIVVYRLFDGLNTALTQNQGIALCIEAIGPISLLELILQGVLLLAG